MSDDTSAKPGFDQTLIRDLATLLTETDLTEIEIEQNGMRLRVSRQTSGATAAFPLTQAQPAAPGPAAVAAPAAAPVAPAAEDLSSHPGLVKSPMVGTIYLSPEPGAAPFVREGDRVSEGQTVLIVEAMKTMNHIAAKSSGTVTRILVANEQPVEFGEPLLLIE